MDSEKSRSRKHHKEKEKQRRIENKRMLKLIEEKERKKRAHIRRHNRKKLIKKIKESFFNFLAHPFGMPPSEIELAEQIKRKRLKERSIEKKKEARKIRFQNFIKHPFGKPLTELEKAEKRKEKMLKEHLAKKRKEIHFRNFKEKIEYTVRAFKDVDIRRRLFKLTFPSFFVFLLAYLTIYVLSMTFTSLISSFWGIRTTLANSVTYYNISPYSPLWTKGSVSSIFTMASIVAFIISFISLRLFIYFQSRTYYLKLYFLWMVLIGQALSIGSFIGSFIRKQGIFYAIQWAFYKTLFSYKTMEYIFLGISIIWLIVFGYIIKRIYLFSSPSATLLHKENRFAFYQFQITIPLIFGIIGILILNAPIFNVYIIIELLSIFFLLLPIMFERPDNTVSLVTLKIVKPRMVFYKLFAITIIIVALFRVIFGIGIDF